MCALEIIFGIFFLLFFLSFSDFLCEASGRYVWGHLDGYPGRPDGYPERPDGNSGCPDDTVYSSGRFWFLSRRSCFRNRLNGTTSGRYLCSIRTVNPVGLNRFLPALKLTFWPPFVLFCSLVRFSSTFYA
jgi:hypothetical protein